mgnify:CR=1 FL=1
MRVTRLSAALAIALALSGPAHAQDAPSEATLADIRQQLSVVKVRLDRLRRELSTTGGADGGGALAESSVLDRIEALEDQLRTLTAGTEKIELRIRRVVDDGTRVLDDLAFRLCELEEGCDPADEDPVARLGGAGEGAAEATTPDGDRGAGPALAVDEQAAFDRARAALEEGRFEDSADAFAGFVESYPGGPLTPRAELLRGRALDKLERPRPAAEAYLNAYTAAPEGDAAPPALLGLGGALASLERAGEACRILSELARRFPDAPEAGEAEAERAQLGCEDG